MRDRYVDGLGRLCRVVLFGWLVVFSAGAYAEATVDEGRAEGYYRDAVTELKNGNGKAAVIQLRNALQRDPKHRGARLLLGELYLRSGDATSAEKELRRAHDLKPDDQSEILLGNALERLGHYAEVLQLVKDEAASPALRHDKLLVRAKAQIGLKNLDQAEALLRQALVLVPASPTASFEIARVEESRGNFDQSRTGLATILRTNPKWMEAWLFKAAIEHRQRLYEQAFASLDQAVLLSPTNPQVLQLRAQLLIDTGRTAEAEKVLQDLLGRDPNQPQANFMLAIVKVVQGDFRAAESFLAKAEPSMGEMPRTLLLGAMIRQQTGKPAQAEQGLERYLALQPTDIAVQRMLASLYLRRGNLSGVIGLLEPATKAADADAGTIRLLASAYMRNGSYDKAAALFERLASTGPTAEAGQAQGILALLGYPAKTGGGSTGSNTGVGTGEAPDETTKGIVLVLDYLKNGDFELARTEINRLHTVAPDNPVIFNLEGGMEIAKGNRARAREQFEAALKLAPDFLPALDNLSRLDYGDGKAALVEERYRQQLARQPGSEALIERITSVLFAQNKIEPAILFLESKIAEVPNSIALRRILISSYLRNKKTDQIDRVARELTTREPPVAAALDLAGRALLDAGKPADAVDVFRKLQGLTPTAFEPRLLLARALNQNGQTPEARSVLEETRKLADGAVPAVSALAELAVNEQKFDQALALADSLIPTDRVAAARLKAVIESRQGNPAQAIETLTAALERDRQPRLVVDLFNARRQAGDVSAALAGLRSWLAEQPDDREIRLLLGDTLVAAGDHNGAAIEYGILLTRDPGNPVVLNNLAWVNQELKRPGAIDLARRAYALAPQSPDVADTLGWILIHNGQAEEGLKLLRDATTTAPTNPTLQYHLAFALEATGNKDDARRVLETLLADPKPFTERTPAQDLLSRLKGS